MDDLYDEYDPLVVNSNSQKLTLWQVWKLHR
jgi:hypothetical protein